MRVIRKLQNRIHRFFLLFLLDDGRIWIRIRTNKDRSGSGRSKTYEAFASESTTTLIIRKTVPGLLSNQYAAKELQQSPTLVNRDTNQRSYVLRELSIWMSSIRSGQLNPVWDYLLQEFTLRLPRMISSRVCRWNLAERLERPTAPKSQLSWVRSQTFNILRQNENWRAADKEYSKNKIKNPPLGFPQQSLAFVASRFEAAGAEEKFQMRWKLDTVVGKSVKQ